jgi:hypothetical protein
VENVEMWKTGAPSPLQIPADATAFVNALVEMSGGASAPPARIEGKSVTAGHGPAPIVYAGDYGDPLCGTPFPQCTWTNDEIVICDRGVNPRVEKAENVAAGGAGGFVLANEEASGDSTVADAYAIPGLNISHADGVTLKAWVATGSGHTATITGTQFDVDPANGDVMAAFSSRGANPSVPDVIKPDVTAPGVDILAAFNMTDPTAPPEYNVISGTSMSSPHAAGAAALVRAAHPHWTPDEVRSALMTTGLTLGIRKHDASTPADPFDMGGGRIDLSRAALAGLILDETPDRYEEENPAFGGEPNRLNIPSMAEDFCVDRCSWERTLTNALTQATTWTAAVSAPDGMAIQVEPSSFTLAGGESLTISVTVDVTGLPAGAWQFARLHLVEEEGLAPDASLPIAVIPRPTTAVTERTVLHFHGNVGDHDSGEPAEAECTGVGQVDLTACGGPFLLPSGELSSAPAARFGPVSVIANCTVDRCEFDPNWIWNLDGPTTLNGQMSVEWWASCPGCNLGFFDDWWVRLWADGELVIEERFRFNIMAGQLPVKLGATVLVENVTAESNFVLHVDPIFINQDQTVVYYDSTLPCPGTDRAPCDSLVRMPVAEPGEPTEPEPDERLRLHFQGNFDEGCTGDGRTDLVACDGPFLMEKSELDDNPAARWVASSLVSGTADRNVHDPNWVWRLDEPTTLAGPMTVSWWAACPGCGVFEDDWFIRLWADGRLVLDERITASPALPGVASRLETTVEVPETTADSSFVLHVDPVYIDTQNPSVIYYDSTEGCDAASEAPCDSWVLMPVVVAEPLPDLVVSAIVASRERPRASEPVTITATISNEGEGGAAASHTQFVIEELGELGIVATPSLAAGESVQVSVEWDTRGLNGEHVIRVTADVHDEVVEEEEENNSATLTVTIRGNRVENGSFEQANADGSGPEGWTGQSTGAGTASWSDGGSHGERSVTITGTGASVVLHGMPSWASDPISVSPGEVLTLSVSLRVEGASSAPSVALAYLGPAGELLETVSVLTGPLATDGFELLEDTITVPAGVTEVRVVLLAFSLADLRTAGSVVFDDVGLFAE